MKLSKFNTIIQHFYRVLLRHHIDANSVAVYFCDFGDISVISLDKLQPLHKKYFDLPYQAIKAKLVGESL